MVYSTSIVVLAIVLVANALILKGHTTSGSNLHTFMTDEEMAHYLETKSHDNIPEYDVVRLSPHRTRRSTHEGDDNIIYKIPAFGKDLLIDLKQVTNSINPSGVLVQRRTSDGRLREENYKLQGRVFHGNVVSDPGSRVALRETGDKGELSGAIFSGDHVYKLEPINGNLKQKADLYGEGHHVVSRQTISKRSSERMEPIEVHGASIANLHHRKKRSVPTPLKPKIVELMITVDKPTYEFYGNGTMSYVVNVANMVNRLYQDVSMGFDISIVLTKVFIIQGFEPGLDYQANNITSAVQYLYKFSSWGATRASRFPVASPGHYDNGVLLSRRICGINSCQLDGVAFSGYPCNPKLGFSVNDATGLQAAFSVAHEMGHNLGLGHDHGNCYNGFIMSAGQPYGPNAFKWSHCSAKDLRDVMGRVKCYDNKPATAIQMNKLPPGYVFDMDKQCKMAFGPLYSRCPMTKGNCGLLFCLKGSGCVSHTSPPLDGSPCGKRKWCMRGKCVDVGNGLPPSVDGQWSSWGHFTPCTRSCGGGVRFRVRFCNNPSQRYFGKACVGLDRGKEEMCNAQKCSTPGDLRTEQCKKEGITASYYHSKSPCVLYCVHGSYAKGHGNVLDGTHCYQNNDSKDVCIRGNCRRVGCDNMLESENHYDRCQKCGGDGNSCNPITLPNYVKNYVVYGPEKPDLMFTIPVGATNVMIKELGKTSNVMSLKLDPKPSSPYVIPVPSYTKTVKAAGTVIKHFMDSFYSEEWIHIQGPTTQQLYAMFIYVGREKNPGISCHYIMPGGSNSTEYVWKVARGETCSADCAGGEKHHVVTCHRKDDGTAAGTRFCDRNTKPPSRESCNTKPCAPQWGIGDWMICSKSCAGGQQTRSVRCQHKVTQETFETLPASSCAQPQPKSVQPCNSQECPPFWEKGPWSKCSAECGGGTRTRTVKCEQTLLNSSIIGLDDGKCMTDLGMKAAEKEHCNTMNCYVWDRKYLCNVCTASKGYYPLGCFGDKSSRALPKLLSALLVGDKVASCYEMAKRQGYEIFGVQDGKECWTSTTGNVTYNKYGASDACRNSRGGQWANDVYEIVQEKQFSRIGCFKDKHIKVKRPLPKFLVNLRDKIDWKDISKTVKECSEDAWNDGFPVFGVQYYGECWSGPLAHKSYNVDGPSGGCWEGVGGSSANYVYAFSRRVVGPTITCRHVVTNVKVPDNQCRTAKPEQEMRLCNEVCKTGK